LERVREVATQTALWTANAVDARGAVTQFTLGSGLSTERVFDPKRGWLTDIETGTAGDRSVQWEEFDYDRVGNLRSRTNFKLLDPTGAPLTEVFRYDAENRLLSAGALAAGRKTYGYNDIGNLTQKCDVGTYYYGENGAGPHAVSRTVAGSTTPYLYDPNGNQTSGDGRTLGYYSFDKVSQIGFSGSSNTLAYLYDPELDRVRSKFTSGAGTLTKISVGDLYEEHRLGSQTTGLRHIFAGGERIAVSEQNGASAQLEYVHGDHLGSTATTTNSARSVLQRLSYDPHGRLRNLDGTDAPPGSIVPNTDWTFTGQRWEGEASLYDYRARFYDPKLGRFLQADSIVPDPARSQSLNRYSYVENRPLSAVDPSGNEPLVIISPGCFTESGGCSIRYYFDYDPEGVFQLIAREVIRHVTGAVNQGRTGAVAVTGLPGIGAHPWTQPQETVQEALAKIGSNSQAAIRVAQIARQVLGLEMVGPSLPAPRGPVETGPAQSPDWTPDTWDEVLDRIGGPLAESLRGPRDQYGLPPGVVLHDTAEEIWEKYGRQAYCPYEGSSECVPILYPWDVLELVTLPAARASVGAYRFLRSQWIAAAYARARQAFASLPADQLALFRPWMQAINTKRITEAADLVIPEGMRRETVERGLDLARRAVDAGRDVGGVQAERVRILEHVLEKRAGELIE
jgi:RHS repeat-associated protein